MHFGVPWYHVTIGWHSRAQTKMAATIKDTEQDQQRKTFPKPSLINKLEGCSDIVNMAVTIPHEDAIISVSQDK